MTPAGGFRGRLVAFEGGEASGKSTQSGLLAARIGAVLTHEPGGTAIGGRIRDLLLDPSVEGLDAKTEALLLAADRAQHVAEVVRPALERGNDVVTDRFSYSSLAYQGFGRGLSVDEVRKLSDWATGRLWPDLVIFLDVPEEVARARLATGGEQDRLESEGERFHARVVRGFRVLAASDPEGWIVVDGVGSIEDVKTRVTTAYYSWVTRRR